MKKRKTLPQKLGIGLIVVISVGLIVGLWYLRVSDWAFKLESRARDRAVASERQAQRDAQLAFFEVEQLQGELARAQTSHRLLTELIQDLPEKCILQSERTLFHGILDTISLSLFDEYIEDQLVAAELHHLVGEAFIKLGLLDHAERHLPVAVELNERLLGEDAFATLSAVVNLAKLYTQQERYDDAEPMLLETLAIQKRLGAEEQAVTLSAMEVLALLYVDQKQFEEAEPLLFQVLEIRQRVSGKEHSSTLNTMEVLARLHWYQERFDEAESLYSQVLEIRQRELGSDHSQTLASQYNLGVLLSSLGRYDEAEPLLAQALSGQQRVLGQEHPDAMSSSSDLALLYNATERFEDTVRVLETSLPIGRRVYGIDHEAMSEMLEDLAVAYTGLGKSEQAQPLLAELLEIQVARAEETDATAFELNSAAWSLLTIAFDQLHDPDRALRFAQKACILEEQHWLYLDTLALAQHRTGDTSSALGTQQQAIQHIPADADPATRERVMGRLSDYEGP